MFIELQLFNGDTALIRADQVVSIIGRDAEQRPARDPRRSHTPHWSSNRGSYIVPADTETRSTAELQGDPDHG